jgi:hypothetical protein
MEIKTYQTNLNLIGCKNEDAQTLIDFDGQQGCFSREEWLDNLTDSISIGGHNLTIEEAEQVCDALENTTNSNFFN